MEQKDIGYYLKGYAANTLTIDEQRYFFTEIITENNRKEFEEMMAVLFTDAGQNDFNAQLMPVFDRVINVDMPQEQIETAPVKTAHRVHFLRRSFFRYAAAIFICIVGIAIYYQFSRSENSKKIVAAKPEQADVMPGRDRAILTLSDGRQVEINNSITETITDGGLVINNNNGELIYNKSGIAAINTMSTPKGGQYKIVLPDGSRVWLNAMSSITYPTAFQGDRREVSVTGEVYLEVARNRTKPFIVKTNKKEIAVLGTSFNINSYTDEVFKTSLVEGAIRIDGKVLQPGQAYLDNKIVPANLHEDLAWKNGFFSFTDADINQVMRQFERWYDIEVVYEGKVAPGEFNGRIGRNLSLVKVLKMLTAYDIKYRIENKKVIISG